MKIKTNGVINVSFDYLNIFIQLTKLSHHYCANFAATSLHNKREAAKEQNKNLKFTKNPYFPNLVLHSNAFPNQDISSASLLYGQTTFLGNFDQCLQIGAKHCLASLNVPPIGQLELLFNSTNQIIPKHDKIARDLQLTGKKYKFIIGICAPTICTGKDLEYLIFKCKFLLSRDSKQMFELIF